MQYSPKLKKAMEEIKLILKKHDIGGYVILHTPGFSEYVHSLSPSYSCIKTEGDNIRFRSRLKEDYNGDKEAWYKKTNDTVNLLTHIAEMTGSTSLNVFKILDQLNEKLDIESGTGTHTSHIDQNN